MTSGAKNEPGERAPETGTRYARAPASTVVGLFAAGTGLAALRGPFAGGCLGGKLLIPFFDFGDDVIHFLGGQFREHGEADARGGVRFRVGNAAGDTRSFAPGIARLFVDRD